MKAVIMAGGKGTRLSVLNEDIPKPMFPIEGKPILEYQIESLVKSGVRDVTMIVGHLKTIVKKHFGDGRKFGVKINYIEENEPLGTAGALCYFREEHEDFVLIFGDLVLDIDFERFMEFHKLHNAGITLFVHPNSHPFDSDVIVVSENDRVIDILCKTGNRDFYYHNLVNAGVYCISPDVLRVIPKPRRIDLEKDVIQSLVREKRVYAYRSTEYVKDMGTPDRLLAVTKDVQSGVLDRRNLKNKQKAIFFDRDGTINKHVGFLREMDDFVLLPSVSNAIAKVNASAFLAILATNQPVVARGEVTYMKLDSIHKKMETELGLLGAYFDDIYFCPHHPDKGFKGEVKELKIDCDCRKPKIGMLRRAAEKYNIALEDSWYIGDTTIDTKTGKNAGMSTILVLTGQGGTDETYTVQPDFIAEDLMSAVNHILES